MNIKFLIVIAALLLSCQQQSTSPIQSLIQRILPEKSTNFVIEKIVQDNNKDVFELESVNGKIVLRGSSPTAQATAFNWYLKHYCNSFVSRLGSNINVSAPLPPVPEKIRKESPYEYRYSFNYCTFNYSMSFWGWQQWEKELDWMALNGINLSLAIVGTEAVWQNTLKRFNFSDDEIKDFICGPAFSAWWLMNNLEGWGGPVSQGWIDSRENLQKKILIRMRELGIQPILQGFYGMVPFRTITKYPEVDIWDTGHWVDFQRPAFINPTDPLFNKMATVYYEEMEKLYGIVNYYGGDPFHEDDQKRSEDFDLSQAGGAIQQAMMTANPKAKWVIQGWWSNPKDEMLSGTKNENLLILDLWSEYNPNWERRNAYGERPWVWTVLSNFGDKVGMFGRLREITTEPVRALSTPQGKYLAGIGVITEGTSSNPVLYDLTFDMAWRNSSPDLIKWINNYSIYRYGKKLDKAQQAREILLNTVYNIPKDQEQASESIFCARPSLDGSVVNMWGSTNVYYNPNELKQAYELLLGCKEELKGIDSFEFDLVDIARQLLSVKGLEIHKEIVSAYNQKNITNFQKHCTDFLNLIENQDKLLATRKEFLLGRWIHQAKTIGITDYDKRLNEWNARTLITTWGPRKPAEELHEYSHREWSGLLKGFYLPRWKIYFDYLLKKLRAENPEAIDFYDWEYKWTKGTEIYPNNPAGDGITLSSEMIQKYYTKTNLDN